MALRLFQIVDTSTGKRTKGESFEFFEDRQIAKKVRRQLNDQHDPEGPKGTRFIVSPGPDHRNYKG